MDNSMILSQCYYKSSNSRDDGWVDKRLLNLLLTTIKIVWITPKTTWPSTKTRTTKMDILKQLPDSSVFPYQVFVYNWSLFASAANTSKRLLVCSKLEKKFCLHLKLIPSKFLLNQTTINLLPDGLNSSLLLHCK